MQNLFKTLTQVSPMPRIWGLAIGLKGSYFRRHIMRPIIIDIVKHSHYSDINYRYELFPYPKEIFKSIKGFPNYEISSYGRILFLGKSWDAGRNIITKGKKIKKPNISKGYYQTTIFNDSKGKVVRPHRLVAEHFLNTQIKESTNHIDGDKLNNHYLNLEWVTVQENVDHAIKTGLMDNRGSNQPNSILTESDVRKIKEIIKTGLSKRLIGMQYGVARETIQSIATKRTWKHIN